MSEWSRRKEEGGSFLSVEKSEQRAWRETMEPAGGLQKRVFGLTFGKIVYLVSGWLGKYIMDINGGIQEQDMKRKGQPATRES